MESRLTDSEALIELVDQLREAGFNIGARHYVAVHELVVRLIAQNVDLTSPLRLKSFLGPLFCSAPHEQVEFQNLFDHWVQSRQDTLTKPAPSPTPIDERTLARKRDIEEKKRRAEIATRVIGFVVIIAVLLTILGVFGPTRTPSRPPEKPTVASPDKTIGPEGVGSTQVGETSPVQPATSQSDINVKQKTVRVPSVDETIWLLPEDLKIPFWLELILGILFLILVVFLIWRIKLQFAIQEVLQRRVSDLVPDVRRILIGRSNTSLRSDEEVVKIARTFRAWMAVPSTRLDIPATISKTVAHAGRFAPVFGSYQSRPDYLFLIQRSSFGDQAAKFIAQLVSHLKSHSVLTRCFFYLHDPRTCFPDSQEAEPLTIRELATKFPDSRVLLFADANSFFNAWTGEMEPWTERLRHWEERVVLTPEASDHWGHLHELLQQQFTVLPASAEGFSILTQSLQNARPYSASRHQGSFPIPEELNSRPLRWIERVPPNLVLVEEVLSSLRTSLGDKGYYWLSACAVFPSMHLNLTLYLGEELKTEQGTKLGDERTFLQLTWLPWFRHGYMPDWLRRRLVSDLPPHRERATRAALDKLLEEAEQAPSNLTQSANAIPESRGIEIDIAEYGNPTKTHADKPSVWRRLTNKLRSVTPDERTTRKPRDYVFHTFMSGRKIDTLAHRLSRSFDSQTSPLTSHSASRDTVQMWLQRVPYKIVLLTLVAYFIGWQSHNPAARYFLSFAASFFLVGLAGATVLLGVGWKRYWMATVGLVGSITILISWVRAYSSPIDWYVPGQTRESTFESPTCLIAVLGLSATAVAANLYFRREALRPVSPNRLQKLSRIVLLTHLCPVITICLFMYFETPIISSDYRVPFEWVLASALGCVSATLLTESALAMAFRIRWFLAVPLIFISAIVGCLLVLIATDSTVIFGLLLGACGIIWLIVIFLAFRRARDLDETHWKSAERMVRAMPYLMALLATSIYFVGWTSEKGRVLEVMLVPAQFLVVGAAGASVILGANWKRYWLAFLGLIAWVAILGTWMSFSSYPYGGHTPFDWWFPREHYPPEFGLDFASLPSFLTVLGICAGLLGPSLFRRKRQEVLAPFFATGRFCRLILILHWALAAAGGAAAFIVTAYSVSRTSIFFGWSFAIIIGWMAAVVLLELVLAQRTRSVLLFATGLGFPLIGLKWLVIDRTFPEFGYAGVLCESLSVGILWLVISILAFRQLRTFADPVSEQKTVDETQLDQYTTEMLLRRRRVAVTAAALGLIIIVGVPLGEWGVLNGPKWINQYLYKWQTKEVAPARIDSNSGQDPRQDHIGNQPEQNKVDEPKQSSEPDKPDEGSPKKEDAEKAETKEDSKAE